MKAPISSTRFGAQKRHSPITRSRSNSPSDAPSSCTDASREHVAARGDSRSRRGRSSVPVASSLPKGSSCESISSMATSVSQGSSAATSSEEPSQIWLGQQLKRCRTHEEQVQCQSEFAEHKKLRGKAPDRLRAARDSALDCLYESEYRHEIIDYMFSMESQTLPVVELINAQPELQWYMRPYLVDFLIEIHQQYRLRAETLHLAMNIVDRYVSKRIVYKKHYQLVGCVALWIAAKFEDAKDRVPTVDDLCAVCCSAYEQVAFIQMEGHVLETIGWNLGHPTSAAWLRMACCPSRLEIMEEQPVQDAARFLLEVTLFHKDFVSKRPSVVAAACLLIARSIHRPKHPVGKLGESKWDDRDEIVKIATSLDYHLASGFEQHVSPTILKKYAALTESRASCVVRDWYLCGNRVIINSYAGMTFADDVESLAACSAPNSDIEMIDDHHDNCSSVAMTEGNSMSSEGSAISDAIFDEYEGDDSGPSSECITPMSEDYLSYADRPPSYSSNKGVASKDNTPADRDMAKICAAVSVQAPAAVLRRRATVSTHDATSQAKSLASEYTALQRSHPQVVVTAPQPAHTTISASSSAWSLQVIPQPAETYYH